MLSVREIEERDIPHILHYWLENEDDYLVSMGVDLSKIPSAQSLNETLLTQISSPIKEKEGYCIIWEYDGQSIGHCNVGDIVYGDNAFMHLHLWNAAQRKKGMGQELLKMTIPYFFNNLKLKELFCQPYDLNPAPNNIILKLGFEFVKKYRTIPGYLNFKQEVNLYVMSKERYLERIDGGAI